MNVLCYSRFIQALFVWAVIMSPLVAWGASEPQPESMTVNRVVAVVNGEMISSFDLEMAATPDLMQARVNPRDPKNAARVEEIMHATLEKMIADIIVVQEAERMKINSQEKDIDTELENMAKRSKLTIEELLKELERQGMKPEQVRDRLRKRIIQQRLLATMVGRKVVVSQEEVAKRFAEMGNVFALPGEVRFAVLIYAPSAPAEEFAKGIGQGHITFEEAVKRASIGPRRDKGGHMDLMKADDVLPALRPHLEGMTPGQISNIFVMDGMKTQLKLLERVPGKRLTTFAEAAPYVEEQVRQPRLEQRYKEYLEQLRKKAIVDNRF